MGKIVLLDDLTINKIAAGEVIERPASAVKELVENSIDAGATSINVEIKNGGISYIRVTDNGKGIEQDDMEIAFERHATSKIRSAKDLETVKSMGFRGEALASIAAISKVTMQSKTNENDIGNQIIVEGGNIISKEEIGCPNGTSITIENLFYNTPVRYKFLRRDFTEAGYIEDALTRIALVHPEISIKLINSGKVVLQTSGNNDINSVIYGIYGKDIAENLLKVDYDYEDIKIKGVIGKPEIARSNRANQLFFVNQRYIKSTILSSGAEQAYKGLMPAGKFSFLVLNLEINPQNVDVNVHPAKLEVRFEEEQKVFRAVYNAIKDTLLKNDTNANNLKNEVSNQQFITDWYQKQEERKEVKTPEVNIENYKQDKVSNIENQNDENENKGFFKSFLSRKDETQKIEKPNLIEQLYETRKLSTISEENVQNNKEEQSNNEINDNEENKEQIINNDKQENIDDNKEENINIQEKVQDEISSMLEKIEELKNDGTDKQETTDIIENPEIIENKQNQQQDNEQKEEVLKEEKNEENKTEIFDKSNNFDIKESKEDDNTINKEINEQFEKMYASIFGKSPIAKEKKELNEEEEKYTAPEIEIEPAENISLFENINEKNIPNYKLIGLTFDNFIIIELEKDLYIINKKIADEKIIYEQLKNNYYNNKDKDSQLMLLPDVINLNDKQMGIVKDNEEMFINAGFMLEEFGANTIKLSGVPSICIELDTKELFIEILEEINKVARTERDEIENKFLITVAKEIANNSKKQVTMEDAAEVIDKLLVLKDAFISPAGKPIAIKMTRADIEKKFARR